MSSKPLFFLSRHGVTVGCDTTRYLSFLLSLFFDDSVETNTQLHKNNSSPGNFVINQHCEYEIHILLKSSSIQMKLPTCKAVVFTYECVRVFINRNQW